MLAELVRRHLNKEKTDLPTELELRPEARRNEKGEIRGIYYRLRVGGKDVEKVYYGKRSEDFERHVERYKEHING